MILQSRALETRTGHPRKLGTDAVPDVTSIVSERHHKLPPLVDLLARDTDEGRVFFVRESRNEFGTVDPQPGDWARRA